MAQELDSLKGTNLTGQLTGGAQQAPADEGKDADMPREEETKGGESSVTRNARKRVAESTSPT